MVRLVGVFGGIFLIFGPPFAFILYGFYRREGENLEGESVRVRGEKT